MNINQLVSELPYETRSNLFHKISEVLEKQAPDNDGRKINRIEKDLTRFIVKRWTRNSTIGVKRVDAYLSRTSQKRLFTKTDEKKILNILEKQYNGIEKQVGGRVARDFKEIYRENKLRFSQNFELEPIEKVLIYKTQKFDPVKLERVAHNYIVQSVDWKIFEKSHLYNNLSVAKVDRSIVPTFGAADEAIVKNLVRLELLAIGDHFPKTLKPNVQKIIRRGVVEKGLNIAQAGEFLKVELVRRLGGRFATSAVPAAIQLQGLNATNAYFQGVVATNVTFTKNFGQVQTMDEAGVSRYVWDSIIDNLTSQICLQMNGRVFEVETAQKQMTKILAADNVAELQQIAPFTRNLSAFNLSAGQKLESRTASEALAKAGITMPPIHFRCRSEVNPF